MSFTSITLDPPQVTVPAGVTRAELELNQAPLQVADGDLDWGDAAIQAYLAESTRGELPVDFRIPNRHVKIPLLLNGTPATAKAARRRLQQKVALIQAEGGWLKRGADKVGPTVTDGFGSNTLGNYTADVGVIGDWSIAGGTLSVSANLAARHAISLTGSAYGDARHTVKVTPGTTVVGIEAGVRFKGSGSTDVEVIITATGLFIRKLVAGTPTNLTAAVMSSLVTGTPRWLRAWIEGDTIYAEAWTTDPATPGSLTPDWDVQWKLTGSDATTWGAGTTGAAGLFLLPVSANASLDDYIIEPAGSYLDVVNATLTLPDKHAFLGVEADIVLDLECLPDSYGLERPLPDHVATGTTELTFTETGIDGDAPARMRLVVDNDGTVDQLGLLVGVRSRYYDPAATAALSYEAEALTPLDIAAVAVLAGASGAGSNTIRHGSLDTSWTPVLSTNLLAGTALTHKGSHRVWARVYTTSASVALRFVWDVGDLVYPEENDPVAIPGSSNFYLVDLGDVRLDSVGIGAHRWQGQLQAKGALVGNNISVDKLFVLPTLEGSGRISAPVTPPSGLYAATARDNFNAGAGALNTKSLVIGGAWSTLGTTTDLAESGSGAGAQASRSAVSDATNDGRIAIAGTSVLTATAAQVDFSHSAIGSAESGVLARYIDSGNLLAARIQLTPSGSGNSSWMVSTIVASGPVGILGSGSLPFTPSAGSIYRLLLTVDVVGRWTIWIGQWNGSTPPSTLTKLGTGLSSLLATGGTLASGKTGFNDRQLAATATTRSYYTFLSYAPTFEAVAYAGRSLQMTTVRNIRQDPTGAAYGPVPVDRDGLLRLPPAGLEGRTVQVLVKPSRGDLDQLPDSGIDNVSARLFYRPSYLTLP